MNMVRVYETILIIIVVSIMDIGHAMKSSDRDQEIVMIPTPGHPNNPPSPDSSSINPPNPDEILGDVFNQIKNYAESPLSTLRVHLRSDQRIMNENALRMELVDRCVMVFNTPQMQIKGYLILACRFLTGYVSIPLLTISSTNVEIHPYDNEIIRGVFDYLFKHKETKFSDKLNVARKKIPNKNDRAYISDKCRQIPSNTADRMVWQVVGCDFIVVYF